MLSPQERASSRYRLWMSVCAITGTIAASVVTASPTAQADGSDLPNFHMVSAGVYRGAAPTTEGLKRLKEMGVKTVIDLRIAPKTVQKERAEVARLGMKWINLPMSEAPPTQAQVDALLVALKSAPSEPVFVHCQHGADRTGCMLGIYRETQQGWDFDKTYAEMRKYGFKPYYLKLKDAVHKRAQRTGKPADKR